MISSQRDYNPTGAAFATHAAWSTCKELADKIAADLDAWQPDITITSWSHQHSLNHIASLLRDVLAIVEQKP